MVEAGRQQLPEISSIAQAITSLRPVNDADIKQEYSRVDPRDEISRGVLHEGNVIGRDTRVALTHAPRVLEVEPLLATVRARRCGRARNHQETMLIAVGNLGPCLSRSGFLHAYDSRTV